MPHYRAEILTIIGSYCGRIEDFVNTFWNLMAFRTSFRELVSDDQVKEDALMCRKLIPALDFLKSEENRPQFLLPRRFSGSQISCKSVNWLWNFQVRYKKLYRAEKKLNIIISFGLRFIPLKSSINLFWIEVYTFEIKFGASFIFFLQIFRWYLLILQHFFVNMPNWPSLFSMLVKKICNLSVYWKIFCP